MNEIIMSHTCSNAVRNLGKVCLCHVCTTAVFPKVCSTDPKESATTYEGICGYISLMSTTFKFTYLLIKRNVLLKINAELLYFVMFLFRKIIRISN
jgi:hypothetical protein